VVATKTTVVTAMAGAQTRTINNQLKAVAPKAKKTTMVTVVTTTTTTKATVVVVMLGSGGSQRGRPSGGGGNGGGGCSGGVGGCGGGMAAVEDQGQPLVRSGRDDGSLSTHSLFWWPLAKNRASVYLLVSLKRDK
jgi:hypothetical protein